MSNLWEEIFLRNISDLYKFSAEKEKPTETKTSIRRFT
jgi:hypothetical protein